MNNAKFQSKSIKSKEARAMFIKFLMVNNCYKEYIECYRNYLSPTRLFLTPSEVFDNAIDYVSKHNGFLPKAIGQGFLWPHTAPILSNIHGKNHDCDYAYRYWERLYNKCAIKLSRYHVE